MALKLSGSPPRMTNRVLTRRTEDAPKGAKTLVQAVSLPPPNMEGRAMHASNVINMAMVARGPPASQIEAGGYTRIETTQIIRQISIFCLTDEPSQLCRTSLISKLRRNYKPKFNGGFCKRIHLRNESNMNKNFRKSQPPICS